MTSDQGSLEQSHNSTAVHWLEHDDKRMTIGQWTEERGLGKGMITDRLARGWSVGDAIDTPRERAQRYLMPVRRVRRRAKP